MPRQGLDGNQNTGSRRLGNTQEGAQGTTAQARAEGASELNLEGMGFPLEMGEGRQYSSKGERHEGRPETGQEGLCVGCGWFL